MLDYILAQDRTPMKNPATNGKHYEIVLPPIRNGLVQTTYTAFPDITNLEIMKAYFDAMFTPPLNDPTKNKKKKGGKTSKKLYDWLTSDDCD